MYFLFNIQPIELIVSRFNILISNFRQNQAGDNNWHWQTWTGQVS